MVANVFNEGVDEAFIRFRKVILRTEVAISKTYEAQQFGTYSPV